MIPNAIWKAGERGAPASCPRCILLSSDKTMMLPCVRMNLRVDLHLSVAFVEVESTFKVPKVTGTSFIYELPTRHNVTVTGAAIFLQNDQVFEAIVVEDTPGLGDYRNREGQGMAKAMKLYRERSGRNVGKFDPELFALPFHGAKSGEEIKVNVKYMVAMEFIAGDYCIELPTRHPPKLFTPDLEKAICLDLRVFKLQANQVEVGSRSHKLEQVLDNGEVVVLKRSGDTPWVNSNLLVHYSSSGSQNILASALCSESESIDEKTKDKVNHGVMSVFVAPPREQSIERQPKDVVFLLDRSGSMGFTNVMEDAKQALIQGLNELSPKDRFAICAFDDRQVWFAGALPQPSESTFNEFMNRLSSGWSPLEQPATDAVAVKLNNPGDSVGDVAPQEQTIQRTRSSLLTASSVNVEKAKAWVTSITAAGLTDIMTPLKQATYALHSTKFEPDRVSIAFLITDGAVQNEREICGFANVIAGSTRMFAFGIGSDCNSYFLRKLASIGRGYSDVALVTRSIKRQMTALIQHAQSPILTDVTIVCKDEKIANCEWTPKSTPDLFYNSPVIVSMKYSGQLKPQTKVVVSGKLYQKGTSAIWSRELEVSHTKRIPLQKVFAQQNVQDLVADSWLAEINMPQGKKLREEAVRVALDESIPCPFTATVAVQTNLTEYMERKKMEEECRSKGQAPKRVNLKRFRGGIVFLGAVGVGAAFGTIAAAAIPGGDAFFDGAGCCGQEGECCALDGCEDCACDCAI